MIQHVPDGEGPRYFGVYPALVNSIVKEPGGPGRIEVRFPWLGEAGKDVRALATLCTPYADDDQGFEFIPSKDSQVLVAFEAGDLRRPYVLGACWNGRAKLPEKPIQEANNKRVIQTRSGLRLEFDDTEGASKVTLKTKNGHELVLDEGQNAVSLKHKGGSFVKFDASGNVTIKANAQLIIQAASVSVTAASSQYSGSVKCTSFTSTSVSSPLYTQGAGNFW
jgi:uncharacterized protein involved in type VI secretion and phage assembly